MKGKDITVGMDVAVHPTSNSSAKYNKPYRGEVIKIVNPGDQIEVKIRRSGGRIELRTQTADERLYEVKITDLCGSGDWSQTKLGQVLRVKSTCIWRPWDEEKTRAEAKAAAQAREEQRRLSTWAAYDAMIADIQADLALIHVTLPELVLARAEWDRRHRDAPRSLDLPLDFIALLAGAIG